jgi:hypothetical protein
VAFVCQLRTGVTLIVTYWQLAQFSDQVIRFWNVHCTQQSAKLTLVQRLSRMPPAGCQCIRLVIQEIIQLIASVQRNDRYNNLHMLLALAASSTMHGRFNNSHAP